MIGSIWVRALLFVIGLNSITISQESRPGDPAKEVPNRLAASPDKRSEMVTQISAAIDRGIRFLRAQQDLTTGAVHFMPGNAKTRHPGVTAMAVTVFANAPRRYRSADGPFVRLPLEWLASLQKPDGSIYEHDSANYVTSAALLAFTTCGEKKWQPVIDRALDYIVKVQCMEENGYRPGDKFFGGVGYGSSERPDLSNTQFSLEAAHRAGLSKEHKLFKNATVFLQRCQNLSEVNDQVWLSPEGEEVHPGNDGGAIYNPGESKAGVEVLGDGRKVFKSYGSMSYALLKSYLFCGLDRNDPRVRAVAKWCADHFDVEKHPGFEPGPKNNNQFQGLYYYYFSMSRALRVFGETEVKDQEGVAHDWRFRLAEYLLGQQQADGTFVNQKNGRWQENSPILCTTYALLALQECLAALE